MSVARDAGVGPASALASDSLTPSETHSGFSSTGIDPSSLMPSGHEASARGVAAGRWLGWRRRALVVVALLGCVGLFTLLRALSATPFVDAAWRTNAKGQLVLASSGDPQVQKFIGETVLGVMNHDGRLLPPEVLLARRSPRWVLDDIERRQYLTDGAAFAKAVQQDAVPLRLAESGATVDVRTVPRGYAGLGSMFWLMTALALVFYLIGAVVVLVQPDERNLLYGLAALAQTTHLLLIGLDTLPGFGMPARWAQMDLWLRIACDVVTGAACVHALSVHPRRLPFQGLISVSVWAVGIGFIATVGFNSIPGLWWWVQAMQLGYFGAGYLVLTWSYRLEPHPMAIVIRRLGVAVLAILLLLTAAIALSEHKPEVQHFAAGSGALIWYVFQASALMLVPFLSRSQQVMREFTLLAGISAVATSLDLLFVAVFALGQFTSHTLALFLALGLYAGARQWMLNLLMGSNMLTTERMFESLYRIAREIETAGGDTTEHFARLLRELFEPLELAHTSRIANGTRVVGDGSTLMVPLPRVPGVPEEHQPRGSLVLRFARRGRRMFTREDARLTDRVLEQLVRAVAFDRAVEQGRNEERARIAQDLHDDIGARLLTLMYKAQSPEMEDYVRHTLQDLKTLTRGLAAASHLLSHASAEWKADITQRLEAAHCELDWSFDFDRDINLTVVQWSALTRMLRELINNVIAHASATRVDVSGRFERSRFTLRVSDDGGGRQPESWAHGLGLGGIRKRVKLLGGEVRWRENAPRGIACEIRVPELGER
ncbi:MAG TPA: ATP-binding protein [Burkholderiaceae bacterium]|nr:ATP-binding protein [Burkholderiaceae bacterium]